MSTTQASEASERQISSERPAPRPRRSIGPVLLLTALLVAGGGFLLFFYLEHEPQRRALEAAQADLAEAQSAREALDARLAELEAERERLQRRVGELRGAEGALRSERDRLARERDLLMAGNEQAQAALAAIQAAQDTLRERLAAELASGDAELTDNGDSLSLALHARILFPPGQAELNPRGREVLTRVAASLADLSDRLVRVEGHTDSTPISPENAERFPTNWELSTTRATTVVRFLEDQGIAGDRLAAVGYGPHRPVADNDTARGRRRNRRIELVIARSAAR